MVLDLLKKLYKKFNGGAAEIISLFFVAGVIFYAYGCESKVPSVLYPNLQVTRAELAAEIDSYLALAEIRFTSLDQQDRFKQLLFEQAVLIASGGTINVLGLLTTVGTLFGIGAVVDNRRKAKVIKNANSKNAGTDTN